MLSKVKKYIDKYNLIEDKESVVIGISGGADSVCLFLVLCELFGSDRLVAVHINHMIRDKAADEDEKYVVDLCNEQRVKVVTFKKDIQKMAIEEGLSTEEAGRKYRYECFESVANEYGATKIAVAHHKNDVAETVLFNMIRGSELLGIAGIARVREKIIRPLLDVSRMEIESYLKDKKIKYQIDESNNTDEYSRNKIRHHILPEMIKINSNAIEHIDHVANAAREYVDYVEEIAERKYRSMAKWIDKDLYLSLNVLMEEPYLIKKILVYKAITRFCESAKDIKGIHVSDTISLIEKNVGKMVDLPEDTLVYRDYQYLIFKKSTVDKRDKIELDIVLDFEGDRELPYGLGNLKISKFSKPENYEFPKKLYTKAFDYDKIKNILHLRFVRDMDYIVINQEGNTKHMNRYFIDNKVPQLERRTKMVVADENQIVWVLGMRTGDNYKIDKNTCRIIELEYRNIKEIEDGAKY